MSTIIPQGELIRKAVAWISEVKDTCGKPLAKVIEEAAMRFNLSPKDVDFLTEFFAKESK